MADSVPELIIALYNQFVQPSQVAPNTSTTSSSGNSSKHGKPIPECRETRPVGIGVGWDTITILLDRYSQQFPLMSMKLLSSGVQFFGSRAKVTRGVVAGVWRLTAHTLKALVPFRNANSAGEESLLQGRRIGPLRVSFLSRSSDTPRSSVCGQAALGYAFASTSDHRCPSGE